MHYCNQTIRIFKAVSVLFTASILFSACILNKHTSKDGVLNIQEQGSFAVGGTVTTNPGTFDPYKPTPADKKFRAFEKSTGKLLWETTLPALANATACTYQTNGKQYVAISVGGTKENPSGSIMAFAIP